MFKETQLTLYDFFGYLLPGAIISLAIGIAFWAVFWPSTPVALHANSSTFTVMWLLFIFYLVGHLGQAIGNLMERLPIVKVLHEHSLSLSQEPKALFLEAVAARFGPSAKLISPDQLFLLCDQTLVHHQSPGEREIFVYREGFYRGASVALFFLCVSTVLRLIHSPVVLVAGV